MDTIGEFIAHWRTERGLTQTALGQRLGLSQAAVSAWEIGRNDVGREDFFRIVEALDVPEALWDDAVKLPKSIEPTDLKAAV